MNQTAKIVGSLFFTVMITASAGCGVTAATRPEATAPPEDTAITSPTGSTVPDRIWETGAESITGTTPETESETVAESAGETTPEETGPRFDPLDVPLSADIQHYIFTLCEQSGVPFCLVMALIEQESGFRADAISATNDYGLMQINQINHKWLQEALGITDFLDPAQNVLAGIYILSSLTDKFSDPHQILMAYNLGEAGARRLWKQGIITSKYSKNVVNRMQILRGEESP